MEKEVTAIILFLLVILSFGAVSKESFYSSGSEFIVIDNPSSSFSQQPRFYALYDDTKIFFDINNDGAYDYDFIMDTGGPQSFTASWPIVEGTRVFSDKPIHYVQPIYFYDYQIPGSASLQKRISSTMPPSSDFKQEYLLYPGTWNFIANNDNQIFIDQEIDGVVDGNISIDKSSGVFDIKNYSRVFSNKPFFAYSNFGFAGAVFGDFYSNEDKALLVAGIDNTKVSFDFNNDGVIDSESYVDRGVHTFDVVKGSRIMSTKPVSAYGFFYGANMYGFPKAYFPLSLANTVTDEFTLAVKHDFPQGAQGGHSLLGLFNSDSAPNAGSNVWVYNYNTQSSTFDLTSTGSMIPLTEGFYLGKTDTPVLDFYSYYYNQGAYVRIFNGHTIAYKKIYLVARPKSKYNSLNSTSIFNVRVINPFRETIARNIAVKFRFNGLTMPVGSVNYKKASLDDDLTKESGSKTVSVLSDENGSFFLFNYDNELEAESYLDIDFSLLTPAAPGIIIFEPAELSFEAETWII